MDREFTVARTIDARPREVFRALTVPSELEWFRSGLETEKRPIDVDLRVGGAFRVHMVVGESTDYITGGIYREVVPNEKLVFVWGAVGGWPELVGDGIDSAPVVTVTLEPLEGGRTNLQLTSVIPAQVGDDAAHEWMHSGMREGWDMTIDRVVEKFAA